MRISKKVIGPVVFTLAGASMVMAVLIGTDVIDLGDPDAAAVIPDSGENAASAFEGGEAQLLQTSGSLLQRKAIEAGTEEELAKLPPGAEAVAPMGSDWIAFVAPKEVTASDTTSTEPAVYIMRTEDDEPIEVGPGISPMWNPSGTRLAFLEPVDPADCTGLICDGPNRVVVIDPEDPEPAPWTDKDGDWQLKGWVGGHLLVLGAGDVVEVYDAQGGVGSLDIAAEDLLGGSPDGKWLIAREDDGAVFLPYEGGEIDGEPIDIDVGELTLAQAFWSPDSSQVLAIAQEATSGALDLSSKADELREQVAKKEITLEEAKEQLEKLRKEAGGVGDDQLLLLTPEDPTGTMVEQSFSVSAPVLWSPDLEHVLFVVEGEFNQATYCPIASEGSCSVVTSWDRGVRLLRLE